jgi:hypothetical protein
MAAWCDCPALAKAGIYQITLSDDAWIDVIQNGRYARSVGSTGRSDCPGVRKSVRLDLDASPVVLQVSGVAPETIALRSARCSRAGWDQVWPWRRTPSCHGRKRPERRKPGLVLLCMGLFSIFWVRAPAVYAAVHVREHSLKQRAELNVALRNVTPARRLASHTLTGVR